MTREFLAGSPQADAEGGAHISLHSSPLRRSWHACRTNGMHGLLDTHGFQKICYFAAAAGIPVEVSFEEGPYGPFSSGLKRVLARLVNNGLLGERSEGRYQLVETGPTFADSGNAIRAGPW